MATFALVHGSWCGAWCWDLLTPHLRKAGHDVVSVDLPCEDSSATFDIYADVVCAAVDGHEDVIAVGHSLGANTIPLVAARRPIRHLVYVCGVIPGVGPYPIQEHFCVRSFGTGVRHRGAAVAIQITNNANYTAPVIVAHR